MSKQNLKTAIRDHQKRTGVNYTTARREVLSTEHDTSPAPFIAQAASTTDPEVLQALEDIYLLERHFFHLRAEFTKRVTGSDKFFSRREAFFWSPIPEFCAVGGEEKPCGDFGRWKQGPHGRGWVPAKNSKMEAEFDTLNGVPNIPLPGADEVRSIFLGNYVLSPIFLALDGKAWLRFSQNPEGHPDLQDRERIGTNWVRERHSDAVRAIEDWNSRNSGKRLLPLDESEKERVEFLLAEEARRKEERRKESEQFWKSVWNTPSAAEE